MASKDKEDIFETETTGGQTSTKKGLHSSAQKPANAGPDAHQKHKTGPIPGAFGDTHRSDNPNREDANIDKAHRPKP